MTLIADHSSNSSCSCVRRRIGSITEVLLGIENCSKDRLQEWIRQGYGIGRHLLCGLLLLRSSALVRRLSGSTPRHQWRPRHSHHVRSNDWRTVSSHHFQVSVLSNLQFLADQSLCFNSALGQSAPSMSSFAKAKVAAAKIYRIVDHKPTLNRNNESGLELESVSGLVELKNVDFSYPSRPDVRILNNFSLTVPAGKTIALVGSSGSGKSTVVSLIERFYDPVSGK